VNPANLENWKISGHVKPTFFQILDFENLPNLIDL